VIVWRFIAVAVALLAELPTLVFAQSWEETTGSAYQAYERGRYVEAEKLFQDALTLAEQFDAADPRLSDQFEQSGGAL